MPEQNLSPRERQLLKARAHQLKPLVLLGAAGLSEMVLREIDRALSAHELVKVKVPGDDREHRAAVFSEIAEKLDAAKVQSIGKTIVLFRPLPPSDEKQQTPESSRQRDDGRSLRAKSKR
ncbi:MAG: ribosome assembly RNA-binding protein YhbY [Burkholderiaceae bacterium]|nr:ribosome assembly RNA-binding protein YhbY [Burkholderiaceae bacterium]